MRNALDRELEQLNNDIIEMGTLIEIAIASAITALKRQDRVMAESIEEYENKINAMEKMIESKCLRILLSQQPVAKDLRLISAALKMITDMERIGDQAYDISEITLHLIDSVYIQKPDLIGKMAEKTVIMVNNAVDCFVKQDKELAEFVIDSDDEVDDFFIEVRDKLINLINQDKNVGEQAIDFIMIAKYLERIGDHAVNVAERVIFMITGKI